MSDLEPSLVETAAEPRPKRWRRAVFTPALLRILVILAVAAGVFAAYFVTWVHSREAYFTSRNFRILAGLSKQIESIVEVQSEGLRYGALGETVEDEVQQETELSISYRDDSPEGMQTHRVRLASRSGGAPAPQRDRAPEEAQRPILGFEAYPQGAYLRTSHPENPRKLGLEPLLDPLLSRDVFDHVVVADANGKVLFEKENREIRLASLAGLSADPATGESGGVGLLRGREATARVREVDLSGSLYEVFITPLRVPVAREKEGEGGGPWLVCGLVRSDRFRAESLALPRLPLIGFVVLLAVLLLAWPLLKLRSMEGWEHLSKPDLAWLAASMFLIPALLTLAVWGGWRVHALARQWDEPLKEIADEIDANLGEEVRAYESLLEEVDLELSRPTVSVAEDGPPEPAGLDQGGRSVALDGLLSRLPFLDVSWIRRDGCQVHKVNFGRPKVLINVEDREYFRSLARDVRVAVAGRNVFVESINSWTTGEPELVVAVDRPRDPQIPVVAMAVPLVSLIDTVLPPGFEYAVVQNTQEVQGRRDNPRTLEVGEVLLHSDKRRNLRENFLQETTDPAELTAMVTARESGWSRIVYQGKDRRVYTRPLSVTDRPWSLVVLADADIVTAFSVNVTTAALGSIALYGLLVSLLFLAYSLVRGPRGFDWLWPRDDRPGAYAALSGFLLALILVDLYVLARRGSLPSLGFAALFPVALLAGLHEALNRREEESWLNRRIVCVLVVLSLASLAIFPAENTASDALLWLLAAVALAVLAAATPEISAWMNERLPLLARAPFLSSRWRWTVDRPRRRYLFCLLLGSVLLAVLPSISFFDLAFNREMDSLVREMQLDLANRLENRERRLGRELGERFPGQEELPVGIQEAALPQAAVMPASLAAAERCEGVSEMYPGRGILLGRWLERRLELERRYEYGHLLFDTCVCYERAAPAGEPSRTCSCRRPSRTVAAQKAGSCRSPGWTQAGLGMAGASLRETSQGGTGPVWRTATVQDSRGACYEIRGPHGSASRAPMAPIAIITRVPLGSPASPAFPRWVLLLLAAAAAWVCFLLIRFATSMLFFQGIGDGEPEEEGEEDLLYPVLSRSGLPLLEPPPEGSGWKLFDLRDLDASSRLALDREDRVLVIDHFDDAGPEADGARQALLRDARGRRLVLLCARYPNRLLMPEPDAVAGLQVETPAPIAVREGDRLRLVRDRGELGRRLRRDPALLADVETLEQWFVHSGGDQRKVLDAIGEAMRAVHEIQWSSLERAGEKRRELSQEDKLILWALVRGKWITAKAGRRLHRLAAKGFLRQDPRLRIVSRSQAIFIRNQTGREVDEALRSLDQQSPWQRLKMPLAIAVVLLLVFLVVTQRELFDNAVTLIGAAGGGLAALLQFFSEVRGGKRDGANAG